MIGPSWLLALQYNQFSQVSTDNKDISLGAAGTLRLPLARSSISETDTVVRVTDGNIVALGGLMKLDLRDNRGGLPGTGDNAIGNFLRNAALPGEKSKPLPDLAVGRGDRSRPQRGDARLRAA